MLDLLDFVRERGFSLAMVRTPKSFAELAPRGLDRVAAAKYIGVGLTMFLELVEAGSMPPPRRIGARTIWDRHELDSAFDELPSTKAGGHEASIPDTSMASPFRELEV